MIMEVSTSSKRPVLALEDLEEMEGLSLEDMLGETDEPITSPFVPKPSEDPSIEVALDELSDLKIEDPEPIPEPVAEKPKRKRRTKEELAKLVGITLPEPVVVSEDDDFTIELTGEVDGDVLGGTVAMGKETSIDDLDAFDTVAPECAVKAYDPPATRAYDPIEAMITSVGDVPEWMTIVVYGKNGTGKTTFGASGKKTLVLEVEKDGTFSVRDRGSEAKKYPVKSWDDFEKIYWYLKKNPGLYEVVCIDTLTRLRELCLRSIVLNKKAEGAELLDKDVFKVTLPQYGDINQRMKFWLDAYADLPCHKVWLCQEGAGSEDKDVAGVDAYPELPHKIRVHVCSEATIIGRTEIKFKSEIVGGVPKEIPQFIMRVSPSELYLSKDRSKALGAGLVNPKIDKLIAKVYA